MKNSLLLPTLLLAAAIVIAGYFIGNMHKTGKEYDRYVQVKGLSEREVQADLAVWPINAVLTGNDLKTLRAHIENQNEQVYQFFLDQGFNDDELTRGMVNITDARQVAEKFARDSDSKVGPIRVARQGQFSINDRDQNTPEIKIIRVGSTIDYQLVN
jgi:hypothetical protein